MRGYQFWRDTVWIMEKLTAGDVELAERAFVLYVLSEYNGSLEDCVKWARDEPNYLTYIEIMITKRTRG